MQPINFDRLLYPILMQIKNFRDTIGKIDQLNSLPI